MINYNNIKEPTHEQLLYAISKGDTSIIRSGPKFIEEWTIITEDSVPNVQPWYLISTHGRVYSMATSIILKTDIINSGYERIQLRTKDNGREDCLVHRLVLENFYPIINMKEMQVNHKDTIKIHNWITNLEWSTQIENMLHAYRHNLRKKGSENNLGGRFSEEQVHIICKGIVKGLSPKQICEEELNMVYNHTIYSSILLIAKGQNWKHVSYEYGLCEYCD